MAHGTATPDDLLARWFWPHYPPDVRADPEAFRDVDANPAHNPTVLAHLADGARLFAANAPRLLRTELPFDDAGVALLSRALDRATRDRLIAASDPDDPLNAFFNTVVHASLFVGEVIASAHGGTWSVRRPLWESVVKRPSNGAVPPFHWLLKHLADTEIDRGSLAYRFHVHVVLATRDPGALAVITSARALPVLKHPTYDLLVKYLHQHLPSLTDLGAGFPSASEFTERRYDSVSFVPLHGGRVLAVHGHVHARGETIGAVEIHWLTASGYDHTDAVPCDESPPYFARATGDALEVTVAWNGKPLTHRVSFIGHG